MAVASLPLCSYPSSHLTLSRWLFSYQPLRFFLYCALGISGGMQAFSSKEKKTFLPWCLWNSFYIENEKMIICMNIIVRIYFSCHVVHLYIQSMVTAQWKIPVNNYLEPPESLVFLTSSDLQGNFRTLLLKYELQCNVAISVKAKQVDFFLPSMIGGI